MTNELRDDIRRKAEEAYSLANPRPKPSNKYVTTVLDAVLHSPEQTFLRDMNKLGEERAVDRETRYGQNILPHKPKEVVTSIELRTKTLTGVIGAHRPDYKSTHIHFDTPIAAYLVVDGDRHRWGDPVVWIEDLRPEDKTQIIEYFEAHLKSAEEHNDGQRHYERSIYELVESCTTLKQLLEVWPAAESLVPADKIQKMHTKVTRIERAKQIKEEISFDPTVANQAVLTAKMLGG
jgi:hypothetical protein